MAFPCTVWSFALEAVPDLPICSGEMTMRSTFVTALLAVGVMMVGCGTPGPVASAGPVSESASGAQTPLKHITMGVLNGPNTRPSAVGPARTIQPLVHSGLTVRDGQ